MQEAASAGASRKIEKAAPPPPLKERAIPAVLLRGFWDELARRRVDMGALQRISGVRIPPADDFVSVLPEHELHALFEAAVGLTGDPALGVSVGNAMNEASLHLIGHLILASATLRDAISFLLRVQPHVRGDIAPLFDDTQRDLARFGFVDGNIASPGRRVETDFIAVLMYHFASRFVDTAEGTLTVHLAMPVPADASVYTRAFHGHVRFAAEATYLSFPRAALDRKRMGVDPALSQQLFQLVHDRFPALDAEESWSTRVRRTLRGYPALRKVDALLVARALNVTPRGLQRRLALEGENFSSVLDSALYERACAMLVRGASSSAQVAEGLGYSELSSFYRAFRRWSGGLTPNEYRARHPPQG